MYKYLLSLLFIVSNTYAQSNEIVVDEAPWPYVFPGQVENQPFVYTTTYNQNSISLLDFTSDGFMDYMVVNGEIITLASYQETGEFTGPASAANFDTAAAFLANYNVPTMASVNSIPPPEDHAEEDYVSPGGYLVFPMATNYHGCYWWSPPVLCYSTYSCETLSTWDKVYEKLKLQKELEGDDGCRLVVLPPDGKLVGADGKVLLWDYKVTRNGKVIGYVYKICKGKGSGTGPANRTRSYRFYRRNRDTGFEFGPVYAREDGDKGLFIWPLCGRPFYMRPRNGGPTNGPDFPGGITAKERVNPSWNDDVWHENSPVPFTFYMYEHCSNGHPDPDLNPVLRRYVHMEAPCANWLYANQTDSTYQDSGDCTCP